MRISYNKLWKMLIDKGMNKHNLKELSGVSSASIAKLGKGDNITTDVLIKICESLDCTLEDIMDCLLYTSPSPRDLSTSRMPSSA